MSKANCSALTASIAICALLCLPIVAQKKGAPASSAKPAAVKPAPAELPAGPMQETARNACTVCHDAGIIVQQRLSKDAWVKEVDKMVRWGTLLDPKDRDPLIDYLSTNFPPDKQAGAVARVSKK